MDVLQYALKSKVFVQDVHGFLKQYGGETGRIPEEHVWVYDEAQRAWDAERVREKRGHDHSEPEDFLLIGSRKRSWALMVGLIGEGQEIYLGEEAGLGQWNDAIANNPERWTVHCPSKIADIFSARKPAGDQRVAEPRRVPSFSYCGGRPELGAARARWTARGGRATLRRRMEKQGYRLYVTRELASGDAVRSRALPHRGRQALRLPGIIQGAAESTSGSLTDFYSTQRMKVGPWYYDPPGIDRVVLPTRLGGDRVPVPGA